ncbi:MAG: sulfatase-like hydrolase/transferase [Verrucomicrobiota bacterium]
MTWKKLPAVLTLGCLLFASSGHAEPLARPNILWLVSEDNNPFLGCYGDPLAHTPTLDKLSREGITYDRCFAQPVCAPSRFALITGMFAVSCGPAEHMRASGKIPPWLTGFPSILKSAGYYVTNNAKTDYNSPISPADTWNESSKKAHYLQKTDPSQPFFSVFNHEVTHESCLFPENGPKLTVPRMDPAKVRIPPYQPDTPEIRADWARYYDCMSALDDQIAQKLEELEKSGLAQDTIIFYYGDNGGVLPRSKRCLQKSGTHVPLIVYYPPKWKHLAPAKPGTRISDPVTFVDFAPTVLSLVGIKQPEYMQGRAFAGPSKATPNEFVFCTRDRMDERYDMIRSVMDKRWLYIHNYRPDLPYVQHLDYQFQARGYQSWARVAREGKLTKATAMFWGEKPTEELYDMVADPDNVRNLAGLPSHQETLARMRTALRDHTLEVVDNGFLPEGSALEGYDASRASGAFPLERAFQLANLASERKADNLAKFLEALEDPSEPVRWWAAQGCGMLREKAAPAETALLKHLQDSSGAVRVAAAEALAYLGKQEAALPVLESLLRNKENAGFTLQAANVLARLGEKARPSLGAMKQALAESGEIPTAKGLDQYGPRYPRDILRKTVAVLEGTLQPLVYPDKNLLD